MNLSRSVGNFVKAGRCERFFSYNRFLQNSNANNLFGSLVKEDTSKNSKTSSNRLLNAYNEVAVKGDEPSDGVSALKPEDDVQLQKYIKKVKNQPELPAKDILLSPLKKKIYEANCKMNGGFFTRDTVVAVSKLGQFKLKLSQKEIEALEPSVYLKSARLGTTPKKATQLCRLLNGLDLKKAITQCHFSKRHVSRYIGELLEQGIEDANKLKLDPNDLYISQIWTGSDGNWMKRIEAKGRGRVGKITHRFVHVRCILKSKSVTLKRLAHESELKQQRKKPWVQLADKPVRGVTNNVYKW
ncbi:hypothetical protein Kpol_480p30 [Vanderwaltozyma polyspora DSM 70294]|uniref:Ribosomal protein L22 n=1 Tax=Vanderwaltozyma polyspora (strain ATCC 22028 / DSM 70294 / BCRC 21397 / CBS 2163 / NBRC 10782 / NRRL Y-8283 / UCD 57-17) TaxID=436907 RepID=A7TP92_VANPO|nr:uncharacterized protein Kpol_480p30 [Vanderwaltozyma polyspora DSM 70294]EDO15943.1 hypothetical protein Kpol_480p30 [Vanderwaltozyma polyspora DSM 70294]